MTEAELNTMPVKNGFRLRGSAMTRLEAFSDAAFAFAMSMLVISVGEIPKNYQDLILALKGTPAFAASFGSIMLFWIGHRTWSRRFGLEDAFSIFLSFALVFTVLVYLYPLKIVFSAFFTWISGGWLPSNFT
ncbi:MAG: TMEM175 family protein, partial [Calditrichaceae bacterium]